MKNTLASLLAALAATLPLVTRAALDTDVLARAAGRTGTWIAAESVYKITVPRDDLPVRVDGWTMPPYMGLTSWAAFTAGDKAEVMVMGDLVLFEDEVNPVMSALLTSGVSVTALHNHFFYAEPAVFFMHLGGEGPTEKVAGGVKAALDTVHRIRAAQSTPAHGFGASPPPEKNSITPEPLEAALGKKADRKNGMVKFVIGRIAAMDCGCDAGKEMGINTWAAFAGADDNAVVDGDFAVHETELQPVLRALRTGGVNIVAIHHHMIGETPRTLFLHYWGRGTAVELARTLHTALELTP